MLHLDELGLPAEMQTSMGPALAWTVTASGGWAADVQGAAALSRSGESEHNADSAEDADQLLQTSLNELQSEFDKASAHLMTVVGQPGVTPAALGPDCDAMASGMELDQLIAKLPASFETLRTLRACNRPMPSRHRTRMRPCW